MRLQLALNVKDLDAAVEFYSKMFGIGAFSPNDILEKENMNGYKGGDDHWIPLNLSRVGDGTDPE